MMVPGQPVSLLVEDSQMSVTQMSVGQRIRQARKAKGWSQQALAAATGEPQPNISWIEQDKIPIGRARLNNFARAMNVDVDELSGQPRLAPYKTQEQNGFIDIVLPGQARRATTLTRAFEHDLSDVAGTRVSVDAITYLIPDSLLLKVMPACERLLESFPNWRSSRNCASVLENVKA